MFEDITEWKNATQEIIRAKQKAEKESEETFLGHFLKKDP